jgi:hypothetical protein
MIVKGGYQPMFSERFDDDEKFYNETVYNEAYYIEQERLASSQEHDPTIPVPQFEEDVQQQLDL